jgi:2-oxoisovalerate dehydrogenase E1 component
MPKSITIDPTIERQPGVLTAPEIPLNQYVSDPAAEAARFGTEGLRHMYRDMSIIRAFETGLDQVKREGSYKGIDYKHGGPAHLSVGQEASVVGQAWALTPDDFILGSHRSHGEILAKGLSAIQKLDDAALMNILETYMEGKPLRAVEKHIGGDTPKDLAINYLLYGALAEIFGRENGFNKGMGGSMHTFFPPFGVMPNNALVGGSADIATGMALYKRVNRQPGIVIANIGDASAGCGPVWEAMMFAAMDQYRTLWDDDLGGTPPVMFNFFNNFYGMGGQPKGETMGFGVLARMGLGVNPEAMHAERVDGYNPLAVADATARKKHILLEGRGPVMMDVLTYRLVGHSTSDASSYRNKEELELWRAQDSIAWFAHYLNENRQADAAVLDGIHEEIDERIYKVMAAAASVEISPRIHPSAIGGMMFSEKYADKLADRQPEVLQPLEESRYKATQEKFRFGLDENGKALPKLKCLTYAEAIFEAMIYRFYQDPTMVAYGEENRDWGGAFGAYRGLTEALPYHRLFNSPISEAAIVGTGVGYALAGGRAVVELMYCDFMGRAGDEIFNQMAKWQSMSANVLHMPLVLRVSVGARYGAQHSQDWSSLLAHIPGLKVFFPATPYDVKGMLNLALRGTDPVVFFESQRLYPEPETVVKGGVPKDYYEVPLGEPAIYREGRDVTIVTIGATLYRALEAADILEKQYNLSAEVIDARFINPLNYDKIIQSVKKTGKIVLASDAVERGSFLHNMASTITRLAFDHLDGPVAVVGARNWITPPVEMEDAFFPQASWIIDAIHQAILPLPGYTGNLLHQSSAGIMDVNRLGV